MAERFGGKYSPGAAGRAGIARTGAGPGRTNLLFAVALLFVLTAFRGAQAALAPDLAAFAVLTLAAWLTRDGIRAAEAYADRPAARRPAIPRKIFASALTGIGLWLGGYVPGGSLAAPAVPAVIGAVLHIFAFGPDPLRDKGMEGVDPFQQDRVAEVVTVAEQHLSAMRDAIARTGDRALTDRVDRFRAAALQMCRTVEADPRDLAAARKWLVVYVTGARDATVKFADLWSRARDPAARAGYEALLSDLEDKFAGRTGALLNDNRSDLSVEIDVLRDRLSREGPVPGGG